MDWQEWIRENGGKQCGSGLLPVSRDGVALYGLLFEGLACLVWTRPEWDRTVMRLVELLPKSRNNGKVEIDAGTLVAALYGKKNAYAAYLGLNEEKVLALLRKLYELEGWIFPVLPNDRPSSPDDELREGSAGSHACIASKEKKVCLHSFPRTNNGGTT